MNYRSYVWLNRYLSSIQKGVQAYHVLAQMTLIEKYGINDPRPTIIETWATEDETAVFLDGGFGPELSDNCDAAQRVCLTLKLPFGAFSEDLNYPGDRAFFTGFGVIVPENIWLKGSSFRPAQTHEKILHDLIVGAKLAT